jgi:hypothetical protein
VGLLEQSSSLSSTEPEPALARRTDPISLSASHNARIVLVHLLVSVVASVENQLHINDIDSYFVSGQRIKKRLLTFGRRREPTISLARVE